MASDSGEAEPQARHEVEAETLSLGDPEGSPSNPTGTLAVRTGWAERWLFRGPRTGTSAEIWRLAWPVMISQVFANLVSLVDVAMVGRIGPAAQAAVGYAAQLFFLSQSALFAIGFACLALMARAIGADDPARARRALLASLLLALAASIVLAAAILAAPARVLGWLNATPAVVALCVPYLRLLMLSSIVLAFCMVMEAALRADRDTRTPMQIALAATIVKVAGNVVLIFGLAGFPRLELVGAGIATLGAQMLAFLLFAAVALRQPAASATALRHADLAGALPLFPELVRVSIPAVLERFVMNFALLAYFALLASYGTVAAAAYTIGVRILAFSWIPGMGYAQGAGTLVGQALGAGDPGGAERAAWRAGRLALVTAIATGALAALAREPLARLFTDDAATIHTLGPFMLCLALAQPAMQLHFTLAGAFRGGGDTWSPLVAAFLGNWIFRVPLAWLAAEGLGLSLVWVWAVLILDYLTRAGWMLLRLRRNPWRHAVVPVQV